MSADVSALLVFSARKTPAGVSRQGRDDAILRGVVGLRLGQHDAAVDREGFELDAQAVAAAVRPGCADPRPDSFLAFAAILDCVGDQCGFSCSCCVLS
jgi:hypothetical protein